MEWQFTAYTAALIAGMFVVFIVLVSAWQYRHARGVVTLVLISLSTLLIVFGYAMELASTSVAEVRVWLAVQYIGGTPLPVWVLVLALIYSNKHRFINLINVGLLLVVPMFVVLLAMTNANHELIWANIRMNPAGHNHYLLDFDTGWVYWIRVIYTWALLILSVVFMIRAYRRSAGVYRSQLMVLLIATALPSLIYLIYLAGLAPPGIDITPYGVVASTVLLAWGMFHHQILDIMPVAYDAILQGMSDPIIVIDSRKRILDMNPAAHRLFPQKGQQIQKGASIADLIPDQTQIDDQMEKGIFHPFEISLITGPHCCDFEIQLSPLENRGTRIAYICTMRDITLRVNAQRVLHENLNRLEILRMVDQELVRKLDVDYVATIALDAAMRMSHADYAVIELIEGESRRIISSLGKTLPEDVASVGLNDGISGRVLSNRAAELISDVSSDSDYFALVPGMVSQMSFPLLSGDKLIGVMNFETSKPDRFTQDIFESIRLLVMRVGVAIDNAFLYESLEKLVEELDAFAHTVAHDLKNPLTAISGYAQLNLMGIGTLTDDEIVENSAGILDYVDKAVMIIDALLMLARVRSAEVEVAPILDMKLLVKTAQDRFKNLVEEHQAIVIMAETWPVAVGYGPWVTEVWANYFNNALKYGGRPPRIELGWDQVDKRTARFWVKDNGAGISREEQKLLFRPFTRLGKATTQEGHGLGLSIVQRIANRLNGRVGVESTPGDGSRFYFTLPIHDEAGKPAP